MKQTTFLFLPFLFFLFSLMFVACGKDYTSDLEAYQNTDQVTLSEVGVSMEAPAASSENAATPTTSQVSGNDNSEEVVLPMMNVPAFGYYTLPENSPPLFSKSCLASKDPSACSAEALNEWLNDQLKNTENGLKKGAFSVQYIFFEIDKNGEVFNVQHVGSDGNTFCWPCADTALETIKKMPAWMPAMKDGKSMNAALKLPVRFEVI